MDHLRQSEEKLDFRKKIFFKFTVFDALNILPMLQNIEILLWKAHAKLNL